MVLSVIMRTKQGILGRFGTKTTRQKTLR